MSELPKGWVETKLPNVAEVIMGQSPSSSDCNDYGEGMPFFQGKTEFKSLYPEIRKYCTKPKKIAFKHDVLLSVRAPVGPTNFADRECVIGRGLAAIRSSIKSEKYLLYFFRNIEPWLSEQGTGTTFKAISGQFIRDLRVPFAPLAEQKRIVEKLDQVLAQVDTIKARLDGIPAILKRFRQSVLATAVSGKLTEEWRVINPTSQSTHLEINEVCISAFDGPFGSKLKTADYTESGVRVVRLENIGHLEFHNDKKTFVSFEKYESLKRNTLIEGDVLFSSFVDEETRVCVCRFLDGIFINKADCFCLRPDPSCILSDFLAFMLASHSSYSQIKDRVQGITRPRVNLKILKSLSFNIPSLEEQTEIVRLVDQYFAFADTIEAQVQKAQQRVDKLTQSILAKAFRGELVPQAPNDEPADELLKRIATARAEAEALTKAAKKATKKTTKKA